MEGEEASTSTASARWALGGTKVPKSEIVFFAQTLIIFTVIVACICNLSITERENETLWSTLLASCLGYMLPNPNLKKTKS